MVKQMYTCILFVKICQFVVSYIRIQLLTPPCACEMNEINAVIPRFGMDERCVKTNWIQLCLMCSFPIPLYYSDL